MINKLKNNTKIKLISLLSALVLWLYVMTVEDPIETRTFSDIPIAITNINMIEDRGLAIYPKEELFTDISINANLSSHRAINRNNIYIYGRVEDPKEGKNNIYLQANLPERVNKYDIKPQVITVNLEKVITEKRNIKIDAIGTPNINIDTIEANKQSLNIQGPRSIVNKVKNIKAVVDVDRKSKDFSTRVKLVPVDINGEEVKGVTLEEEYVIVSAKLLKQKNVPIKLNIIGPENDINKNYNLDPEDVIIEGKEEVINNIESISTQPIKVEDIKESDTIEVPLDIPNGVKIYNNIVSINLHVDTNISTDILIPKSDIEFINQEEDTELNLDKVPDDIKITIIHSSKITDLKDTDIKLYVDLSDKSLGKNKYVIKYESKLYFNSLKINPENIEIN